MTKTSSGHWKSSAIQHGIVKKSTLSRFHPVFDISPLGLGRPPRSCEASSAEGQNASGRDDERFWS